MSENIQWYKIYFIYYTQWYININIFLILIFYMVKNHKVLVQQVSPLGMLLTILSNQQLSNFLSQEDLVCITKQRRTQEHFLDFSIYSLPNKSNFYFELLRLLENSFVFSEWNFRRLFLFFLKKVNTNCVKLTLMYNIITRTKTSHCY